MPERNHADILSAFDVDQRQQPPIDDGKCQIQQPAFVPAARFVGALVWIVVEKAGALKSSPCFSRLDFRFASSQANTI
jgi:hypothetical protein